MKCQPRLADDAAEELQNQYVLMRDSVRQRNMNSTSAAPIPITVRQLEGLVTSWWHCLSCSLCHLALVRIAEALAKQELSPVATKLHVQEAIRLFRVSTLDAASSGIASAENLTPELMQEIVSAENLLRRRLAIGSKMSEVRRASEGAVWEEPHSLFAAPPRAGLCAQQHQRSGHSARHQHSRAAGRARISPAATRRAAQTITVARRGFPPLMGFCTACGGIVRNNVGPRMPVVVLLLTRPRCALSAARPTPLRRR